MPSDEALRVTLVCTLPLLHFSLVRILQARLLESRLSNVSASGEYSTFTLLSSSSALAFGLHACSRRCPAGSELPLQTHNFRSFSDGCIFRLALFSHSSGLWAVLRSGCNPLTLSRRLTSSRGTVRFRISSCLLALEHPVLCLSEAPSSPFLTKSAVTLTVLLQATGPVLQEVRLPASVWYPTLPCALSTRLPPPWLGLLSAPRSLRRASSERGTYTVPFRTSPPVLASSYLPCSGRLSVDATALSFVTVR